MGEVEPHQFVVVFISRRLTFSLSYLLCFKFISFRKEKEREYVLNVGNDMKYFALI